MTEANQADAGNRRLVEVARLDPAAVCMVCGCDLRPGREGARGSVACGIRARARTGADLVPARAAASARST